MSLKDQVKAAQAAGTAERLTVERWKWDQGVELDGVYMGRKLVKSTKKELPDFYDYLFQTDDGPYSVLFSTAFDKTTGEKLVERHLYSVTYKGKVNLSKGRTMHVYVTTDCGAVKEDESEQGELPL